MATTERIPVSDAAAVAVAEVVRPRPDPPAPPLVPPVDPPSPTQAAQQATLAQTGADPPPAWTHDLDSLALQVLTLRHNYLALARRLHAAEEYIDTVSSPLYKRLWWVCCGYRFRTVGRWYPPKWKD